MGQMPPNMWENERAFEPREVEAVEERGDDEEHEHGPNCGHVAVEHGDHVDYVVDGGHRHWWNKDKWEKH